MCHGSDHWFACVWGLVFTKQAEGTTRALLAVVADNLCHMKAYLPDRLQSPEHQFVFLHQGGCDQ